MQCESVILVVRKPRPLVAPTNTGSQRDRSNKAPITRDDRLFLCNLAEDVTEMKNLAAEHSQEVARFKKVYEAYASQLGGE